MEPVPQDSRLGRRNFLSPLGLGQAVSVVTGGLPARATTPEPEEGWLCQVSRRAMATRFQVFFEAWDGHLVPVIETALDKLAEIEDLLSIYRPATPVSRFNACQSSDWQVLPQPVVDLVRKCLDWGEATAGAFSLATKATAGLPGAGEHLLEVDPATNSIRKQEPEIGLDFGGVGKGYALDETQTELMKGGLQDFLIHGGNSSILAHGRPSWDNGWVVALGNPLDWEQPLKVLKLKNSSLSTTALSPAAIAGQEQPHVLDPRTGQPVHTELVSVTVLTQQAAVAEAYSTALMVLGAQAVRDFARDNPDLGIAFSRLDERGKLVFEMFGLNQKAWEVVN